MSPKNTYRKSRFHDEKGNRIDLFGLFYFFHALLGACLRICFNFRPQKPTISFRATKEIKKILKPHFQCVEFGSGMSTVWLAKRCDFLLSRENNRFWYNKIKKILERKPHLNVQYQFCDEKNFSCLTNFEDKFFDFAMVDGWDRTGCIASVLPKLKDGGWLYLDNSDKDMTFPNGDIRRAESLLLHIAAKKGSTPYYFVDFSRANFFVEQGLLIKL